VGTAPRGARSDCVLTKPGLCWGGELDMIPVLEVGTGVGSCRRATRPCRSSSGLLPVFWRLNGFNPRGSIGEDGSKAGKSDVVAGLLTPAVLEIPIGLFECRDIFLFGLGGGSSGSGRVPTS
jgi:hypothetical protein